MKNTKSLAENTEVIYRQSLDVKDFWDYLHNIDTSETKKKMEEAEIQMSKQIEEENLNVNSSEVQQNFDKDAK